MAERASELAELKKVLRALVVSSPVTMTAKTLLRDYRAEMGRALPAGRFGHSCPVRFLRQECADCFLFQGPDFNPTLILIVPKHLKHIDEFVQKQKISSNLKYRVKRCSVQQTPARNPSSQNRWSDSLDEQRYPSKAKTTHDEPYHSSNQNGGVTQRSQNTNYETPTQNQHSNNETSVNGQGYQQECEEAKRSLTPKQEEYKSKERLHYEVAAKRESGPSNGVRLVTQRLEALSACSRSQSSRSEGSDVTRRGEGSDVTRRSDGGARAAALRRLQDEVRALVAEREEGVPADELPALYRLRHHQEMDFARFGYTSIAAFALDLELAVEGGRAGLELRARPAPAARPPAARPAPAPAPRRPAPAPPDPTPRDEDALPGIDYAPEVFPADCMHHLQSIPGLGAAGAAAGDQLDVCVGEVYGPSHFWVQLLGDRHSIALEDLMDDMNAYYTGEGAGRQLAMAAAQAGHYCAALFERDWHRALIVRSLEPPAHSVKVRHVDYGTVDQVPLARLKPLLRRWSSLPAQAVRARLAGIRPPAGARRWPIAASTAFLDLVRDKRFVASVVSVDREESILSLVLVDTSTAQDVRVDSQLVRAGYAEHAPEAGGVHEYPRFEALESGATPNYAEIHRYLRDGVALDCVPEFARHVPPLLPPRAAAPAPAPAPSEPEPEPARSASPPPEPAPSPAPASPRVELLNRVPVFPASAVPPQPAPASPAPGGWLAPLRPCAMPPPAELCAAGRRFRTARGEVTLSVAECEVYWLLLRVDPNAAHWYMVDAISRACLPPPPPPPPPLNPLAREFRLPPPGYPPSPYTANYPPQFAPNHSQQFAPDNYRYI